MGSTPRGGETFHDSVIEAPILAEDKYSMMSLDKVVEKLQVCDESQACLSRYWPHSTVNRGEGVVLLLSPAYLQKCIEANCP